MITLRKILHKVLTSYVTATVIAFIIPSVAFAESTNSIMSRLLYLILSLFSWLAGAMGALMGTAIYETVIKMGSYIHKLPAIEIAWGMFRDLGNIFLVFGFIAIGIATILNNASYGAKRALPKLLIVALTLNFSLFVTEFIIDTGNMFATQFYVQINNNKLPTTFSASSEPISNAILNALHVSTVYNTQDSSGLSEYKNTGQAPQDHWFITFFMGILVFIITAFVLGSIAIMLVTRFVVLIFLLIVSPIGFIGLAGIPLLSGYGRKWWRALSDQTLFAPIILLLLLVVVSLVQGGIFGATGSADWAQAIASNKSTGIASLILEFLVVIGLVLASLIIAKSLSGAAAKFATRTSGKVVFGGLGTIGRGTLGWGAQRISNKIQKQKWSRDSLVGRRVAGVFDKTAKSSFDMRASRVGAGIKNIGIDIGTAQKGGYRASEEKETKERVSYGSNLKLSKKEEEQLNEMKVRLNSKTQLYEEKQGSNKEKLDAARTEHAVKLQNIDAAIKNKQDSIISASKIVGGETLVNARKSELEDIKKQRLGEEELFAKTVSESKKVMGSDKRTSSDDIKKLAEEIKNYSRRPQEQYAKSTESKNITAIADAGLGATIGAAIGTAIAPGLGTAVGVAVGGSVGGVIGKKFGSEMRRKAAVEVRREAVKSKNDHILDMINQAIKDPEPEQKSEDKK